MYSKIASDVEATSSYGVRSKGYEELELTSRNTKSNSYSHKKCLYIFIGLLFIVLLVGTASFYIPSILALQASDVATACNFAQCQQTKCDSHTSPFACLKGAASGRCASVWTGNKGCEDFCDSTHCKSLPSGGGDTAKFCNKCTPDQCDVFAGSCDADSPYVCVAGEAQYGCANDHWPISLSSICDICCDLTSC